MGGFARNHAGDGRFLANLDKDIYGPEVSHTTKPGAVWVLPGAAHQHEASAGASG